MKARFTIPAFAIVAFLFSGCAAQAPEALDATAAPTIASTAIATPTASAAPTRNENARGQLLKAIGQTASITDDDGKATTLTFKVTAIEPIQCDAKYGTEPTGTALAVSLEIETTAEFVGSLTVNGTPGLISFSPHYWKGYSEDDTRMNTVDTSISNNCLTDRTLLVPDYIGKAEKVKGIVILDVTSPTGTVAYSPWDDGGWIWQYPSA